MTGKPEVIGSSVGLVPRNALVLTEMINSPTVGNSETIPQQAAMQSKPDSVG